MASVKQKLANALEFDRTLINKNNSNIRPGHHTSQWMKLKRAIPTFSVSGVFSCQLSPVAESLVMGYGNGDVEVFSTETEEQVTLIQNVCKGLPVTSIRYLTGTDAFFATGPSGKVRQIDLKDGINQCVLELDNEINCLDVNLDNSYLAIVGKKPLVYVYDAATFQVISVFNEPGPGDNEEHVDQGHTRRLFATKFDPVDKYTVMSAGWDCCIKMWDVRNNSLIWNINGPKVCGEGIDKSGHYLLTASWHVKDSLQLWDTRTQKLLTTLNCKTTEDSEFLYCGQFYSTDKVICGGSGIKNLKLIDINENKVVDELSTGLKVMQCLCLSRTKKLCVAAGLGEHAICTKLS